jgi:hypothetical protein
MDPGDDRGGGGGAGPAAPLAGWGRGPNLQMKLWVIMWATFVEVRRPLA